MTIRNISFSLVLIVLSSTAFGQTTTTESFETGAPSSQTVSDTSCTLSTGTWIFYKACKTTTKYDGTYGVTLANNSTAPGYVITPSFNTVASVSFYARGGGSGKTITVMKSVDGGSFTAISTPTIGSSYAQYSVTINETGSNVKLKIMNTAGSGTSMYIDAVAVTTLSSSSITVSSSSLSNFGSVALGSVSSPASYTVSGAGLTTAVTIAAPAGFELSTDNTVFSNSLSLSQGTDSSLAATTVYVRFAPSSATGTRNDTIKHTSGSAIQKNILVSGVSIATEPSQSSSLSFQSVTGTSLTANFGGGNGSCRIVVLRPDSAVSYVPADAAAASGVGSVLSSAANQGNNNYIVYNGTDTTVTVTGLTSGTAYHFAVYEYNVGTNNSQNYLTSSAGTGSQTTLPVPSLTVSSSKLSFGTILSPSLSSEKSYTISGKFLSPENGSITVHAPSGFQISTTSGSGFDSVLTIAYTGAALNATTVYVRFAPSAVGSYSGTIVHSGGTADSVAVTVSGKGVLETPTAAYTTLVVAQDGSGDYTDIQSALNAIDTLHTGYIVVFVKNGLYDAHVSFKKGLRFVALIGESRDGTRIEHSQPRSDWYSTYGTNTGCGVMNIAGSDSCIVIGNMTIINTYTASEDYTEVIRSETGSTKIWTINCKIWCQYKDTYSLWGKDNGRYYASDCSFRGSIDAVCPRGWCYIIGSTFIETESSSPIWHEGVSGLGQKLVVENSLFRSEINKSVKLENSQGSYAQFYYLDCLMSDSIGSQGVSSPTYYWNCHRSGSTGDASWFSNNTLSGAAGSPSNTDVNAAWVFGSAWDPENEMPAVLPFASLPQPFHAQYSVAASLSELKWTGARNASSYNVYFGTSSSPSFAVNTVGCTYTPASLSGGTTYYWRVDAVRDDSTIAGSVWQFTTAGTTDVGSVSSAAPAVFALKQNYPNPFNPGTRITFTVAQSGKAVLKVYDILGKEIAVLFNGEAVSGREYIKEFNAARFASGMYFSVLQSGSQRAVSKMIFIK
jgi:pectinesterase